MRTLTCLLLLVVTPALAAPEVPAGLDDAALTGLAEETARAGAKLARALDRLYADHDADRKQAKRDELVTRWLRERDRALAVIFDTAVYPDEDHGRAGQATVDEHVARVRATYAPLDAAQRKDVKKWVKLDRDEALTLLGDLRRLRERLADLRALQTERGLEPVAALAVAPVLEALLAQRAGDEAAAGALRSELGAYDQWLLQRLADEQVAAANAAALGAEPAAGVRPTAAEEAQVRVTNDYRRLLGREALRLDPRLVASARGHSADMTRLDFFDHTSPVKGKESFSDRIQQAGYPNPGGENIYMGGRTPEAAHDGWYHSSGHHRNILGPHWTALGAGQDGAHWTQNFGR